MLIPLTTDRPRRRAPVLIHTLVLFNALAFVWSLSVQARDPGDFIRLIDTFAIQNDGFQ